ncbi:MAG: oligoendopeptidase F [Vicinamibacterales bacterium]|nr:oligoendopeptidase F [Vicinamibacterales bacterium]
MSQAVSYRPEPGQMPERAAVPEPYKWNLTDICRDWEDWSAAFRSLEAGIERLAAFQGTLSQGAAQLLSSLAAQDEVEALMYTVWYFASLQHDEDQRDNSANARRQQVQILFARHAQATSWFNPELLAIPEATVRAWLDAHAGLALYRFAIESLYHSQEHVLDQQGERLLSFSGRFSGTPHDAYAALTTADASFPTITLAAGDEVTLSYGRYRALLETNRHQPDRAAAYRAFHGMFAQSANTFAALYNGVLQRDWFHARARGYASTLESALHGNKIPTSVVTTLIDEGKAGTAPLRRYHQLRKRALGLTEYRLFDTAVPLVEHEARYPYDDVLEWIVASTAPLGTDYQQLVREAFAGRWIDVFENAGKRSGAYSAPVYGSHPYMLLNYNETLDAVFTLAHEMGHSMHTVLAHRTQPFRYAAYEIFVAEVPSTLSEALFLDFMLARATSREERIVLLQHAIDSIAGTFFTQVLFADFELQAHRAVEQDQPVTADVLNDIYAGLLGDYYGAAIDNEALSRLTWARIPHFFSTPYYVYQYSTCFASTARLMQDLRAADSATRAGAVDRYLALLRAGGSNYPIALLQQAGVDLTQPDTVRAVSTELDGLVSRLEAELG